MSSGAQSSREPLFSASRMYLLTSTMAPALVIGTPAASGYCSPRLGYTATVAMLLGSTGHRPADRRFEPRSRSGGRRARDKHDSARIVGAVEVFGDAVDERWLCSQMAGAGRAELPVHERRGSVLAANAVAVEQPAPVHVGAER